MAKTTRYNNPFQDLKPKSFWVHKASNIPTIEPPSLADRRSGQWIHFDSLGEYELYQALRTSLPKRCVIHKDFKLVLLPKTNRSSELSWKIDYAIAKDAALLPDVFLEYKGDYIFGGSFNRDALQLRLRLAENAMTDEQRIYVVTKKVPTEIGKGYRTHSISTIISLLKGLL